MSAPPRPAMPDEVLEIARTLEAAGLRGLVRRRRAAGRAAGPSAHRLRLRHLGHAGAGARRCSASTAPVGEKYGTVGVLDRPAGAARGDHLPPRRGHRRAPRGRGLRRVARGRSRPAGLHHQRHRLSSAAARVARPVRRRGPTWSADWSARSASRPQRFREDYLRILRRSGSRPGSGSRSTRPPGRRPSRPRRAWRSSPPSGCGTSGSRGCARPASVPELVELWPGGRRGAMDPGAGRCPPATAIARRHGPARASAIRCC